MWRTYCSLPVRRIPRRAVTSLDRKQRHLPCCKMPPYELDHSRWNQLMWEHHDLKNRNEFANMSIDYRILHTRDFTLTSVGVKCAETRWLLLRVPQLDRPISWTREQSVFDSTVSQSPHSVAVTQQRTGQHAGIWGKERTHMEKTLVTRQVSYF